jgi:hypothetical protein
MNIEASNNVINLNKPKNLSLEEIINPDLPRFIQIRRDDGGSSFKMTKGKTLHKHIPALYYLIHILLERQHAKNTFLRCIYARDFVKLYSRDIEPFKSKNDFRYMWSILVLLKVIECYDVSEPTKYRKSAKGYYFRFTKEYKNAEVIQHEVEVSKAIADKLKNKSYFKNSEALEEIDISKLSINKQSMHQYLAIKNLRFDSDAASGHVNKLYADQLIDVDRYNSCVLSINNILNGRYKITQSKVCKRVYTNITSMPKELRQFIRDNEGKQLIELDFSSINAFIVYRILNSISPDYESNAEKIAFENELDLYRRLLSGGDFYTDFKSVFFPNEDLSRDQVKEIVLKHWFNGMPNSRNTYRKVLVKRMPRISEVIDALKSEKYENFSIITMSMESELVNDIIYKKFIDQHPDVIMYTIFDSFLVEQKYAALLQSIMQEEGSKYFNINCFVKVKSINYKYFSNSENI